MTVKYRSTKFCPPCSISEGQFWIAIQDLELSWDELRSILKMHLSSTPQLYNFYNFKIPHAPIDVDPEGTFHTFFCMQTFIWDYFGDNLILVSNSTRPPLLGWHKGLSFKAKILKIKLVIFFFPRHSYSLIFSLGLFYRIHPRIPSSSIPFFLESLHHLQSERNKPMYYRDYH